MKNAKPASATTNSVMFAPEAAKNAVLAILVVFAAAGCGESAKPVADQMKVEQQQPQVAFTTVVNKAPNFESAEGWGEGYARAVGKGAGVIVGPGPNAPNVFAQQFSAKPNERFKIVARASSANGTHAQGRLQINWQGPEAKYVSTSSLVIDVADVEKAYELQVSAPAGTTSGMLYVVPQGEADTVRYSEMRLLGTDTRSKAN